jgi:hypothetical protein
MIGELDKELLLIHAQPPGTGGLVFKGSLSRWLPQFAFCNLAAAIVKIAAAIVENATFQHLQSRATVSPFCSTVKNAICCTRWHLLCCRYRWSAPIARCGARSVPVSECTSPPHSQRFFGGRACQRQRKSLLGFSSGCRFFLHPD